MRLNGHMADPSSPNPPEGEFFEQIRRLLSQLGLDASAADLSGIFANPPAGFTAMPMFGGAEADPDAAWRTTITAAAHQLPSFGADPKPTPEQALGIADAGRLAESWLDAHTQFPGIGIEAQAWTRRAWIEATGARWRRLAEPIIQGSADALGAGFAPDEPELAGLQQMFAPMLRMSASMMYRDQLRRTLAQLASAILTGTEPGFQLLPRPQIVLLPASISAFVDGLELPESEVVLYLALRESARQRLFNSVGWLAAQLDALLDHFAREIRIDLEFIGTQFNLDRPEELTLERISEVGEQVSGSFFKPASTPVQLEILGRLETLLALVEGWVDHVSGTAANQWLTHAPSLIELVRRRRGAGGPEQGVWQTLVGLELRPRRIRDAENLWAALTQDRGPQARDAVWGHPDLVPGASDLDDPLRFVTGERSPEATDLDAELERLLRDET